MHLTQCDCNFDLVPLKSDQAIIKDRKLDELERQKQ